MSLSHDGDRQQFREVSITLQRGRKVGLVGPNGTGKSSLLKVLAGEIPPDEGTVTLRKGATLALVEQEPHLPPDTLVLDAVLDTAERVSSNAPDVLAVVEYNRALAAFEAAPDDPTVAKRVERAAERMETLHAWDTDAFVKTAISRLGLGDTDESYKRRVGDLSGGQRKRVALAAALTARADVVLCDEPTNHLSVEGIAWLEETLREPGLTVACVTHDRAFLDGVCDEIVELDRGKVHFHGPGYEAFLESKAARLSSAAKSAEVDRQRLKKELAWMRKQPKARGTKSRARVDSFFELQESVRVASRVSNTVDGLKTTVSRMGDKVLTLDAATLTRGDVVVLDGVSYEFQKGEKVGVVGDNGVGKSSFLKALYGELPLDSGSISVGETVVFGHFDQDGLSLPADVRVSDYVTDLAALSSTGGPRVNFYSTSSSTGLELESVSASAGANTGGDAKVRALQLLEQFGFERTQQYTYISRLSGGEKRRLQLLSLLLRNPNMLVLDEVSNDLDLDTLGLLEDFLAEYSGCLVVVSHDRYFMDKVVDHLLVFEGGGRVRRFEGTFTEYIDAKAAEENAAKKAVSESAALAAADRAVASTSSASPTAPRARVAPSDSPTLSGVAVKPKRFSYKERKEYEALEGEIEALSARHAELSDMLATQGGSASFSDLEAWSTELDATTKEMDAKTERWVELEERAAAGA